MKTIDIHAHWYPEGMARAVREGRREGGRGRWSARRGGYQHPGEAHHQRLRRALRRSGRTDRRTWTSAGIDVHALSLTTPMVYWASPALGLALSQAFNDAAVGGAPQASASASSASPCCRCRIAGARAEGARARGEAARHARAVPRDERQRRGAGREAVLGRLRASARSCGWTIFLHPVDTVGQDRTKKYYLKNLLRQPVRHRHRGGAPHLRRRAGSISRSWNSTCRTPAARCPG